MNLTPNPFDALTRRERAVVRLLAIGATNDEASRELGISTKTLSSHRDRAVKVLGVRNNVELARLAIAEREVKCPPICEVRPREAPPQTNDEIVAEIEAQDFGPLPVRRKR